MKSALRLPFYLTMQYIRRGNKWTLALTVFLMAVAFINLLFVSSLFSGIIDGANKQIINTMTGNIYITPKEGSDYLVNTDTTLARLSQIDGVQAASARTSLPASLKYHNIKGNWSIQAINPDDEKNVTNISQKITAGSYLDPDDANGILLGRQISGGAGIEDNAFSFKGAQVGDSVTLAFDGVSKDFTIRGIFYTKFITADERAFVTDAALEGLIPGIGNKATTISIKTVDGLNETDVINRIKNNSVEGQIFSWQEVAGMMNSIIDSFLSINVLMTFVGILIAAVTIFIVIYVDIVNKRKQIGILRAIGIKPYIVVFSYAILSAFYAVLGVILGTAIFYWGIMPYFVAHPFVLPICDAVLVLHYADYIARSESIMWVAVFAGLIPAIVITRGKILNAILGK